MSAVRTPTIRSPPSAPIRPERNQVLLGLLEGRQLRRAPAGACRSAATFSATQWTVGGFRKPATSRAVRMSAAPGGRVPRPSGGRSSFDAAENPSRRTRAPRTETPPGAASSARRRARRRQAGSASRALRQRRSVASAAEQDLRLEQRSGLAQFRVERLADQAAVDQLGGVGRCRGGARRRALREAAPFAVARRACRFKRRRRPRAPPAGCRQQVEADR